MAVKRALLVGLNYKGTPNELRGCENDIMAMNEVITTKFGFTDNTQKRVITGPSGTTKNIMDRLKWLVDGLKPGDHAFFHYSGHGSQLPDTDYDLNEEPDGLDEIICPVDLDWREKVIKDDDFRKVFANVPAGVRLTVLLDCCLSKETKIPLLDGSEKTIEELSMTDEPFWVYSSDSEGNIVPGKAHSARITGYRELIRIVLDNGESIECTEDHLIMTRDGKYKEAGLLKPGESLMPLYRKYGTISDGYLNGYELVKNNKTGKWTPTHKMVGNYFKLETKEKTIIHHKNFNKLDNSPENLEAMTWYDHQRCHGEVGRKNFEKMWKDDKYLALRASNEYKNKLKCITKEWWNSLENNEEIERRKSIFLENRYKSTQSQLACISLYAAYLKKEKLNKKDIPFSEWKEKVYDSIAPFNHKVVEIIRTGKIENVYDMTVDEHHNFAVSSGIFVHNCHSGTGLRDMEMPLEIRDAINGPVRNRVIPMPVDIANRAFDLELPVKTRGLALDPQAEQKGLLVSGCSSDQTSADAWIQQERKYMGACTATLISILRARDFKVSNRDLINDLRRNLTSSGYEQTPELSGETDLFDLNFLM